MTMTEQGPPEPPFDISVSAAGTVPPRVVDEAVQMVRSVAADASAPVLGGRVRLTRHLDPAVERPCVAQATIDVNGRPVRAHLAAETWEGALGLLQDRLQRRLEKMGGGWEARRGSQPTAEEHEWRHDSEPTRRPEYFARPPREREIVRRKAFTIAASTPDEAVFDMRSLDHDVHLFTDVATGQDSVVYETDDGVRLAQVEPDPDRLGATVEPITLSPHPAPRLTEPEAVERLNLTGLPFVFFVNADTGRANVLYHRYDGHYGLISPAG